MKMAFVVYNDYVDKQVVSMLSALDIDYFTRWEHVKGKGHGTEPHMGGGSFSSTNAALMIAFEDEAPLAALIQLIIAANEKARRADERIRLFQVPLERMV
jgi:hypothetical protein